MVKLARSVEYRNQICRDPTKKVAE